MNGSSNPFKPTRYEHDRSPLIWLSPKVARLEGSKSVYVSGTRGSGKTSLLRAIHWRERIDNEVLRGQTSDPCPGYISVYFRLPDFLTSSIEKVPWDQIFPTSTDNEANAQWLFSLVVESTACQLLAEAVTGLRPLSGFAFDAQQEIDTVRSFLKRHPAVIRFTSEALETQPLPGKEPRHIGLPELADAFARLTQAINVYVVRGRFSTLVEQLPYFRPGELVGDLSTLLTRLIGENNCQNSQFIVKICLDDCEILRPRQQIFLNTIVRLSRYPVFWVVSYVGKAFEASSTTLENQNLTDADREVIDLDIDSEKEFARLCEAVFWLRLRYSKTGRDFISHGFSFPRKYKPLYEIFSRSDVNALFLWGTRKTVGEGVPRLLARARQLLDAGIQSEATEDDEESGAIERLPIWQTYLLGRLFPDITPEDIRAKGAKSFQAYLRRKQVSTFLSMCSEFRVGNIPYAGAGMILSMSDKCIRDFLEIVGEIYELAMKQGNERLFFGATDQTLSLDIQRRGIARSSLLKFLGIRETASAQWQEVSKLVECLGRLTALLQSDHNSMDPLRTSERGIFRFSLADMPGASQSERKSRQDHFQQLLSRCESDGLLRPHGNHRPANTQAQANSLQYRLHRRFAAQFRYSHRGGYETVRLPMDELVTIIEAPESVDPRSWAARVYATLSNDADKQGRLSDI